MLTTACSACHVNYTAEDLMLSRKKIQKCHVVLEENLDDTSAYWEQAPRNLCILLALQSGVTRASAHVTTKLQKISFFQT
jgi:PHP family Zn ribbon phosphoesterase